MALTVPCTCGKTYQVDESLAGKRVKCKACGAALIVPQKPAAQTPAVPAAADDDEFRLSPLDTPAPAAPRAAAVSPAPKPAASTAARAAVPSPTSAAPATPAAPATANALPFFLAVSSGWSKSLLYRVYADRDALLLLDVGPYNVLIDVEIARRADGQHWGAKTVESLKTWVVSSAGVVLAVLGLLGLGIARAGFNKPNEALQLVSFLVTIAAFVIPGLILLATWSMRVLVNRTKVLDNLTPDGVREECAKGGDKYRLVPGELSAVRIVPPKNPGPAIRHLAEATFKHPSGSWKLLLFSALDVKVAVAAFRRLLGPAAEIDQSLDRL